MRPTELHARLAGFGQAWDELDVEPVVDRVKLGLRRLSEDPNAARRIDDLALRIEDELSDHVAQRSRPVLVAAGGGAPSAGTNVGFPRTTAGQDALHEVTERDVERVLEGHQPPGRPELAEVAFLFARLRATKNVEQAPPMSPQLVAELDAAEVEPRDRTVSRRTWGQPTRALRRRWRMIGAAAVFTIVGGLTIASAQDAEGPPQTEIDAQQTDASETTRPSTTAHDTTTTTGTTTLTPPVPPAEATEPLPPEGTPMPWPPGSPMSPEATEELDRYCDDNPREDWCEWWEAMRSPEGANEQARGE